MLYTKCADQIKDLMVEIYNIYDQMRNAYKTIVGKPEEKRPLEGLSMDGRIVLKWILEK